MNNARTENRKESTFEVITRQWVESLSQGFPEREEFLRLPLRSQLNGIAIMANIANELKVYHEAKSRLRRLEEEERTRGPHRDESGEARRIVTASALSGETSSQSVVWLTPAEEARYNEGMARLAEWG